jgi:hypothetical protein
MERKGIKYVGIHDNVDDKDYCLIKNKEQWNIFWILNYVRNMFILWSKSKEELRCIL